MPVDTCRDNISRFSYETEEHRQVLQDTVVLNVLEIKLLAANDTPLNSQTTSHLKHLCHILFGVEVDRCYSRASQTLF